MKLFQLGEGGGGPKTGSSNLKPANKIFQLLRTALSFKCSGISIGFSKLEFYCFRRKSAGVRVRGLFDKVLGQESESVSKSCENLNVI